MNVTLLISRSVVTPARIFMTADSRRNVIPSSRAARLISEVDRLSRIISRIFSLKSSSDNLKGASAEIRRSPWRLLYHPGPGELDNLELYDAARQFL